MIIITVSVLFLLLLMLVAIFTFEVRREIGSVLRYFPGLNLPFRWAVMALSTHLASPQLPRELNVSALVRMHY